MNSTLLHCLFEFRLYDYVGVIWAKHDIDDSDQLISTGADRRQTPRLWEELETGKN